MTLSDALARAREERKLERDDVSAEAVLLADEEGVRLSEAIAQLKYAARHHH